MLPRVARGDSEAVAECLDRYGPLVWSIVLKWSKDRNQAEDIVQEVFIALWKAADRYDPGRGSEALYITTITRRRLIDRFRSRSRAPELESLDEVVLSDASEGLARVETDDEAQLARVAMERLKPEQRRLLELWIVGGMTHSEIATSTGIPLGTVKSQLRRGLQRLRELMGASPLAPSTEASA